jgi:aryl-alcohol dehydrogenase-like predicted oxidoreductase
MTQAERIARHEAEIAAFHETMGEIYRAWLDAQPHVPSVWLPAAANDDQIEAANDNVELDEAA